MIILVWDEIPHIIEISCSNRILFSSSVKLSSSYTSFNATSSHPNFYSLIFYYFSFSDELFEKKKEKPGKEEWKKKKRKKEKSNKKKRKKKETSFKE